MKKERKRVNAVYLTLLAVMLLGGFISLSFFPADRYSAAERRYLASFPVADPASMADGSYTAALDTYATERFPMRGDLRQAYALLQIMMGQQEVGDVLLCRDGSLAKRIFPSEKVLRQNLKAVKGWQQRYGDILTLAPVPCRVMMREEVLPPLYDTSENHKIWQTVTENCPNAIPFPHLNTDECWYRTDHHWTSRGAYLAYCHLGDALGYEPISEDGFEIKAVCTDFYGTSHGAAGLPFVAPDTIQLYSTDKDAAFRVEIDGSPAPFSGFYDFEKLQSDDAYGIFLGGNHGVMTVSTGEARPHLLVVKDSFANALLPFLAQHFELTVIDPRYTAGALTPYAEKADRILLLCGMQTLCETAWLK